MPRPSRQELLPGFVDECRLAIFALRRQLRWLAGGRGQALAQGQAQGHGTSRADEMIRLSHSLAGTAGMLDLPALAEMAGAQEALWSHFAGEARALEPAEHRRLEELLTLFAAQVESVAQHGTESESVTAQARELLEVAVETIGRRSDVERDQSPAPTNEVPADDPQATTDVADIFAEEAVDHLRVLEDSLRRCAENPPNEILSTKGALAWARRAAHSLKGAAGAVGRNRVAFTAHRLEDLLDHCADQPGVDLQAVVPLWRSGLQLLQDWVVEPATASGGDGPRVAATDAFRAAVEEWLGQNPGVSVADTAALPANSSVATLPTPAAEQSVPTASPVTPPIAPVVAPRVTEAARLRVAVKDVDHLLRLQGDWLTNRASFEQKLGDLSRWASVLEGALDRLRGISRGLDANAPQPKAGSTPVCSEVATHRSEGFDPLELDHYGHAHVLARDMAESTSDVARLASEVRRITGDLQGVLQAQSRMAKSGNATLVRLRTRPFHSLFPRLESAARRIATEQHKEIACVLEGGDVQLDAELLAALSDPLLHLVRNAVDHGIETPAERRSAGKPLAGRITVHVVTLGSRVRVTVRDDGRGLDRARVLDQAVRRGLVSSDEAGRLPVERIDEFVFEPGLSTARQVTEYSGRGVGLDVVRAMLRDRQGTVSLDSAPGSGTACELVLPLTVSTTRVLFVVAGERTFALPVANLLRIVRAEAADFETVAGTRYLRLATPTRQGSRRRESVATHETIRVPVSRLADLLGQAHDSAERGVLQGGPVLVLSVNGRDHALSVDRLAATREVVVKSLGSHIRQLPGLSGMTLLGDGTPVPILNPAELPGLGIAGTERPPMRPVAGGTVAERPGLVAMADDSVSVRHVLARFLEGRGWRTLQAGDGLQLLERLHESAHRPEAIFLDVEMPRLDGFGTLAELAKDPRLSDIPVIMLTSRSGEKHRQRALDLGAAAYLVKPWRDADLLATLQQVTARRRGVPAEVTS